MPKQETPLHHLQSYLPEGCLDDVLHYIHLYKVHLTITRERSTVLGNYRNSYANNNHKISVNGNLNKYSFLITLLHELAHLFTYEKFGNKVQAHGQEWKNEYSKLLAQFLLKKIVVFKKSEKIFSSLGLKIIKITSMKIGYFISSLYSL